jgi:hypothetical protein
VALEQALEALADLGVVGRERQERLVVVDRLVGVVRDVLRELRGLAQEPRAAALVLRHADRAVVERQRVGPPLGDRVDHRQPLQRRVGRRRERRDAHEDLLEDLRIVAEPLVAERAGALADHLRHLRLDLARERVVVERDDVVGAVEVGRHGLDLFPRAHRVRRVFDGGGGFLELRQVGHGVVLGRRSPGPARAPVRRGEMLSPLRTRRECRASPRSAPGR